MTLRFRILTYALAGVVLFSVASGYSSPRPAPNAEPKATQSSNPDETGQAQAALERLFVAWASKDAAAADAYIKQDHRGGIWEFEKVERIEFGTITPSPGDVAGYMSNGRGSDGRVRASDVRAFRATITYHYKRGAEGVLQDGDPNEYMWFVEKLPSGEWLVADWGY